MCEASPSIPILLRGSPGSNITVFIDLNMDDVRVATDGAVLSVLLARPGGGIDGDDDLFATVIADVGGLVLHAGDCNRTASPAAFVTHSGRRQWMPPLGGCACRKRVGYD